MVGREMFRIACFLSKILYYSILHEYYDFSVSRHPYFCEKGGRGRAFCGPVAGVMKKSLKFLPLSHSVLRSSWGKK